jgi:signal transduction histidine kinase
LTDRFMTRFVLRHITEPLGQLSTGVEQIRCGNLGYRIAYRGEDEFAPVCDAFDEMALRLSESVERDRRAEQTRKDLVMGMSHDLRSPLTSIRGYAEGLRDGVPADEAARQRYVEVILDKTGDIERKVSRLLEITKLEESGYPVNVQSLALDDYVRGYGERMGGEFAAQGMQVAYRLEPVRALADTAELDRIMGNLLDNCLKYRAGAHVEVIVHTKVAEGWAELAVSDDGPGVPSENLQRIFDPLYRGDEARGVREGSGLGLSIAAASVERMGGSVCALRSETSGLCVRMRFPMPPSEGGQGA